jgi:predicted dinucleotide-binding enzyme
VKFAVLGTGVVGRSHAEKLVSLGHEVFVGTHDVEKTLAQDKPDQMGNPSFSVWQKDHKDVKLITFADAASAGEIVINALKGDGSVEILTSVKDSLKGKIVIDISNPLDFSKGFPPFLSVCNTDSLGEQVQAALPDAKVVKTCNTTNAMLQVNPKMLADGDHHMFLCGNDPDAKAKVTEILKSYGWVNLIDMGDITNSRGMEMILPIWTRLFGVLKNPMFNFKIVQTLKA